MWRFTWPDDAARKLYIDAASMLMQSWNTKLGVTVPESSYAIGEDGKMIRGYKKALGWTPYKLSMHSLRAAVSAAAVAAEEI